MIKQLHTRLVAALATAVFAAALATMTTTALADTLSVNEQGFNLRWTPLTFSAAGTTFDCNLTLSGSFHAGTMAKVAESLLGHITGGTVSGCDAGGGTTVLTETLPWHIYYESFSGTLPNISGMTVGITGVRLRFDPPSLPACLFETDAEEPFVGTFNLSSSDVTGFAADETASIDLEDEDFPCAIAGDLELQGTAAVDRTTGDTLNITLVDAEPAELEADPTSVVVERLETNDSFVIRNIGEETTAATITRIAVETDDRERPEFAVTGPGCTLVVPDGTSCTYIITVNSRPEADGRITFHYRDGIGGARTTVIDVDIAS